MCKTVSNLKPEIASYSFCLVFILVIYPDELVVKLEKDLSSAKYFLSKFSAQYRAYLGFPERFGHFVVIKRGCFMLPNIISQKVY